MKKTALLFLIGLIGYTQQVFAQDTYTLPALPYAYNGLQPYIDSLTMVIHHTKHHQAYINNLNAAIKGSEMEKKTLDEIMTNVSKYPIAVRNNGGGHWNHSFFWNILTPKGQAGPKGKLADDINKTFGSFDAFKTQFSDAAGKRFGSGWAWLIVNKEGKLQISSTPNQDNPLMDVADVKGTPILALDVWEHAYYLKYQNKRPDYVGAFWSVVNWDEVEKHYSKAKK